jgi:hypothetical protein
MIQSSSGFPVVDVRNPHVQSNRNHHWGPNKRYEDLKYTKRKYTNDGSLQGTEDYLCQTGCTLLEHLLKETHTYFGESDPDRDLAMLCYPFTAVWGLECIEMVKWISKTDIPKYEKILCNTIFQMLENKCSKKHQANLVEKGDGIEGNLDKEEDSESDDDENIFELLRKKSWRTKPFLVIESERGKLGDQIQKLR